MSSKSVLIVDDNEADRYLLKRDLKKIKYEGHIFETENGQEALDFLTDHEKNKTQYNEGFPPAIIFLDINMPIVDGFEFLEQFSTMKNANDIYDSVILMMFTSSENIRDREKTHTYDFVKDYLIKGEYDIESLKEVLNKYT